MSKDHSPIFADHSIIFLRALQKDIGVISKILVTYERASGQKINMEKYAIITFSPIVGSHDKRVVLNLLGLKDVQSHDKYLGLPTIVGSNKKSAFDDIREWIWKRVQGWVEKEFFLSE